MRLASVLIVPAALLLMLPVASGFVSVPSASPHADITREAAATTGWPPGGTEALVAAVHRPDYEENEVEPRIDDPMRFDATPAYRPSHHCDRHPPTTHAEALADAGAYIRERRDAARNATEAEALVDATGEALHALQDCFSHSDVVELDGEQQDRFIDALLHDRSPPDVRLTAFDPGAEEPGRPDDLYPHDEYAKDSPEANSASGRMVGNKTHFEAARDAATEASAMLLRDIVQSMSPAMREDVDGLEPEAPGLPVPGPSALIGLVAMAWLVARR